MPKIKAMQARFRSTAVFLIVYITEAHANDEWPVGKMVSFCAQPKTQGDRCLLARQFRSVYVNTSETRAIDDVEVNSVSVAADTITNEFDMQYSCWPFRYYVVHSGRVALKAQPHAYTHRYHTSEVEEWLTNFSQRL